MFYSIDRQTRPIVVLLLCLIPTLAVAQTQSPTEAANNVRPCAYVPGVSVPAVMPKDLANPTATPVATAIPFTPTKVDAKTAALHLQVYNKLWNTVNEHYVYTNFNGHDWKAIGAKYQALVKKGLSQEDFNLAMGRMIAELGDNHSYFATPAEIQKETALIASQYNYVGIGALVVPIPHTQRGAIMTVFPKSPASDAGLKPHDSLLEVDGGPIQDANGQGRTLGVEGTKVTIKVQRPGEQPRDVTLTRHQVTSSLPIDTCIVPTTHIRYIFLPTFLDDTIDDQVRDALRKMTHTEPLKGLVLDNRMNTGGIATTANGVMELFASGDQGEFISRDNKEPLKLVARDIGGSQTVPLVVLVDVNTVSYGEIVSGVLRLAGRATIIGGTTLGNVERLFAYDMPDGSRLWLASQTFQPRGEANGIWEETGIIPDISVPTRWDLFTEANDPALAKAVDFLTHHK